jgi:probable rRNA maturation factor
MVEILVTDHQNLIDVNEEQLNVFKDLVNNILEKHSIDNDAEVSLVLVDNEEIQQYNKLYRTKDVPTDVLSFPQYTSLEAIKATDEKLYLGDVIISTEKVIEQAKDYNHDESREIAYLFVHSILHLLGYTHDATEDKQHMRTLEEEVLNEYNITR